MSTAGHYTTIGWLVPHYGLGLSATLRIHKHLRVAWSSTLTFTPRLTIIAQHEEPYPSLVFTHGGLSSLNILACEDKVVGIVDWETAG